MNVSQNDSIPTNTSNKLNQHESFWGFSDAFIIVCSVAYVFIISASLLGNSAVCLVILSTRSLRRSINTCFVLSLAVSDLLTTCLATPFDLEQLISRGKWKHGQIMCSVWTTAYLLTVPTSMLNLLVLTIDRYTTLKDPLDRFRESPLMTRRRAVVIVSILWVYSLLFSLAPVLGWNRYPNSVLSGEFCVYNITLEYFVLSSVLHFVVPLFAVCWINFKIYCITVTVSSLVRKKPDQEQRTNLPSGENNSELNNLPLQELSFSPALESRHGCVSHRSQNARSSISKQQTKSCARNTRAAKTILVIVSAFVVCWSPFTLLSIISNICKACHFKIPAQVYTVFLMMGYFNSAINPLLYNFYSPQFKKAVKAKLRKKGVLKNRKNWIRRSHAAHINLEKPLASVPWAENLGISMTSFKDIKPD